MRYDERDRESKNVEDRRGQRGPVGLPGGMRIPIGGKGGMSLTTLLIIGGIMLLFGINPLEVLMGGGGGGRGFDVPQMPRMEQQRRPTANPGQKYDIPGLPGGRQSARVPRADDEMASFIKKVLADTEDVWKRVFQSFGKRYDEPQLVLFSRATRTACGTGLAQMGPFYCPLDRKIYIDLNFYNELKRRFDAPGDFAQAYVVAHEVGHHVQTLLGIAGKVQELKQRAMSRGRKVEANQIQVRMELQADCLSGVWSKLNHQLNNRLEPGDIEEGLNAASQIGDDMIQKRTQGHVVPDAFTHGSAAQRVRWFKQGFQSGQMQDCDTFNVDESRL
ncbi:MAG: neutral zinc metallopeptidase [Alphaproteobacteria bacterium]|nr:neutral zinc metallopeptidase [Alphaproteobacteria bacterium]